MEYLYKREAMEHNSGSAPARAVGCLLYQLRFREPVAGRVPHLLQWRKRGFWPDARFLVALRLQCSGFRRLRAAQSNLACAAASWCSFSFFCALSQRDLRGPGLRGRARFFPAWTCRKLAVQSSHGAAGAGSFVGFL